MVRLPAPFIQPLEVEELGEVQQVGVYGIRERKGLKTSVGLKLELEPRQEVIVAKVEVRWSQVYGSNGKLSLIGSRSSSPWAA